MPMTALEKRVNGADIAPLKKVWGKVTALTGEMVQISGLSLVAKLGDQVKVTTDHGQKINGEIIALEQGVAKAILFSDANAVRVGAEVEYAPLPHPKPSEGWIGCVLDYAGRLADGSLPPQGKQGVSLRNDPPPPTKRKVLGNRLSTGLAAFDTFLPLCHGQRLGLFAGSGVGKSTLLAELAKGVEADIVVLALIGERGREVRSFVEQTLGAEGMKKSIVIAATSNDPAPLKKQAAYLAMSVAEYFRDQGKHVFLLFDSITRFAEAHREVALTAGEVPSLRAFPPSTFRAVAGLAERAGPGTEGTGDITSVFSVLVSGSNMEEPVADMVRGILDGHVVLDREIAERGRYPAIDVRRSVSRSLPDCASDHENALLQKARGLIGAYEEAAPVIRAGLYSPGSDPVLDEAIRFWPKIDEFIGKTGAEDADESFSLLRDIFQAPEQNAPDLSAIREQEVENSRRAYAAAFKDAQSSEARRGG